MTPARATAVAVPLLAAGLAASVAFNVTQPATRLPVLGLLVEVGDVAHGRTPLVDTSATGGWGSLELLGALFSVVAPSEGRLMLATSGLAAVCAALLVALAFVVSRSVLTGLLAAAVAVCAAALGPVVPDSYAPTSGALTLVAPLATVLVAGLGVTHAWARTATLVLLGAGLLWSPAAAALTIAAVLAGASGWDPEDRSRAVRSVPRVVVGALALAALLALVQSGSLPSPGDVWRSLAPVSRMDEPGPETFAVLLWLAAAVGAAVLTARGREARAAVAVGVVLGAWAVAAGSAVGLGYALALTAAVVAARVPAAAGLVVLVLTVAASADLPARWQKTALYDALPHAVLAKAGLGAHVGGSLRYDLQVLENPRAAPPDPLLRAATRIDGGLLLLTDAVGTAQLLEGTRTVSLLPVGDPGREELADHLRERVDEVIRELPDGARLLTRADWLDAARSGAPAPQATAAHQALRRVVALRRPVEIARVDGAVLVTLRPRPR